MKQTIDLNFCDYVPFFYYVSTVYDKTFSLYSELLQIESD